MNLSLAAAKMVLGQLSSRDLVDIAMKALQEGFDSPSLAVLAGETAPIWSEVSPLFERGLRESGVAIPSKRESIWMLLSHLLAQISSGEIDCYEGMGMIDHAIRRNLPEEFEDTRYVGDGLGMERCYTWYRELQDAEDGSMLLYYSDLPRDEAIAKFRVNLIEEARKALERIKNEQAAATNRSSAP